jgi:hypothetical protein
VIRLTLASNAVHLEAARRLRDGLERRRVGMEILLWEPQRFSLTAADHRRWPLRFPLRPRSYLLLAPWALLGLVAELRLAHRSGAGGGLRLLLARARRLTLLDDGLDQYRARPRALDPIGFAEGTEYWLFSDVPDWRAPWCARFSCRDLGPLFPHVPSASLPPEAASLRGTLIIDSPGVEHLQGQVSAFPRPLSLMPHPVTAKRAWRIPLAEGDRVLQGHPEKLLPCWQGTVVVGESLMLLAALRLCPLGTRIWIALPSSADSHLDACVALAAERRPLVTLAGSPPPAL